MKKFSSQPPALTTDSEKETILLAKIKNLEEQLKQVQAEKDNLKVETKLLEAQNKHLKALIQQSTETEAKVIQLLP